MLRPQIFAVALSTVSLVAAQYGNYTVNPGAIDAGTRSSWCQAEYNTCGTLCANNPKANDCSSTDLTYHCTCQNGSAPGLQYYLQTMPTFICQQAFQDCISANVGNSIGQGTCKDTIQAKCGTLDASKADTSNSGGSSSTTSTGGSTSTTGSASSTATASSTSATKNIAAATHAALVGNGAAVAAVGLLVALL